MDFSLWSMEEGIEVLKLKLSDTKTDEQLTTKPTL